MKNYISLALILLVIVVSAQVSIAGPIQGAGAMPCGEWVVNREKKDYHMELSWVMGFMSSYNHYIYTNSKKSKKNGVFADISYNSIALWMDNYCRANPLKTVYSGTLELIEEMK